MAGSKNRKGGKRKGASGRPPSEPGSIRELSWEGTVEGAGGIRADKYISDIAGILSRSQLKAREARFFVNGKAAKPSCRLTPGDRVLLRWIPEAVHSLLPEKLDVDIIFENDDVFVFNKAQGMVTHPAASNWTGTLANAALSLEEERQTGQSAAGVTSALSPEENQPESATPRVMSALSPEEVQNPPLRGGIVHRLDKDTSGVIIVARNLAAQEFLASQFRKRSTSKEYIAMLKGIPPGDSGRIENYLSRDVHDRKKFAQNAESGKHAITDYKVAMKWVLPDGQAFCLATLYPKTGRTHQLRVHMAGLGCPILGDPVYGRKAPAFPDATLMLHARRLRIRLPGESEPRIFKAPVPKRFNSIMRALDTRGARA